jgi:pyruvate,water dikinase
MVKLASLSDSQLELHIDELLAFIHDCLYIHALITVADILVAELALTCQELLGWDGRQSLELLSGLSSKTTEPTNRLGELAYLAQDRPAIQQLLKNIDQDTTNKLAAVDSEFSDAFEKYLQEFGNRTLRWDLHAETLAEKPELVLNLIHDQITQNNNVKTDSTALEHERELILTKARQALSNRSPVDRKKFEHALERAERAYPIREEHEFYLSNIPLALFRYALLELGERLTTLDKLEQQDDIFFLELDEAKAAFKKSIDQKALVTRRKGEQEWVRAHPGPAFYGETPPQPPSLAAFPPEVKRVMQSMSWMIESLTATQYSQTAQTTSTETLQGLAASPGLYTGSVRIIMSEAEFSKLKIGDVLVCPTTQPPWSVLFPKVGALVTDSGGILSHPAIIAREYHVPAVVSTGNATSILHDGQVVSVDGNTGQVKVKHTSLE